jgi:hypothetical protein
MTEIRSEPEWFRAFRLTQFEAQRLSVGQLLGVILRCIVELLCRDQSGAVVALLRHQADLADAMLPPRAERPPPPQWHPWRRYIYRLDPAFDDPVPAKDKAVETDVALASGEALDGAEFNDSDDEQIPEQLDRQLVEARIADALDDVFETEEGIRREAELFEAELLAQIDGGGE